MEIRDATAEDATRVAELHIASWKDAYRSILDPAYLAGPIVDDMMAMWRERLATADDGLLVLVAEDRAALVGFACARLGADARWGALIGNLHTMPSRRSEGVGALLLRSAAASVARADPKSGLHVRVFEQNTRAVRFYRRHGGSPAGSVASSIPSARGAPVARLVWATASDVI